MASIINVSILDLIKKKNVSILDTYLKKKKNKQTNKQTHTKKDS